MQDRVDVQKSLYHADIEVRRSEIAGYGVFARQPFAKGDVIEVCPVLLLGQADVPSLNNYAFSWHGDDIIPLGYGAIYNHHAECNAEYFQDYDNNLLYIKATRPIRMNEEITIYYGDTWFSDRGLRELRPMPENTSGSLFGFSFTTPKLYDIVILVIMIVVIVILLR